MPINRVLIAAMAAVAAHAAAYAEAPPSPDKAAQQRIEALDKSLHPVGGDVAVPGADATLHLGQRYYFLGADDARRVLVEGWGNAPDQAEGVIGMVFPAGKHFYDDTWGAVVTYEASGYVSDSDARSADYGKVLTDARSGEDERNGARQKQGYEPVHLVGWAQPPAYDGIHHALIWARDIKFGQQQDDTLNYDVRLLGRRGVLSLNMVSAMSRLPELRPAAVQLADATAFDAGARYADYQKGDTKADYGLAGLVAAGVGAVAAKKLGLIATVALFGKKFLILIVAAIAALRKRIARLFGRGGEGDAV